MKIEEAITLWLNEEYDKPAISRQTLLSYFLRIWLDKEYKNQKLINVTDNKKALNTFNKICKRLERRDELWGEKWSTKGFRYFMISNRRRKSVEHVLSAIYPIGYIGYMSAIKHYNLSLNKSDSIYFVTTDRATWKRLCLNQIYRNFPELKQDKKFLKNSFENISEEDLIPTYPIEEEIGRFHIVIVTQKNLFPDEEWDSLRVESLPYLYIDMLRNPKYCGGLGMVLQIYATMGDMELKEVIQVLDRDTRSNDIDKARLGFICDKIFKKENSIFLKWKEEQRFKRGGTRKLVSYLPFEPIYDEDWNISVNYDLAKPYASSNLLTH